MINPFANPNQEKWSIIISIKVSPGIIINNHRWTSAHANQLILNIDEEGPQDAFYVSFTAKGVSTSCSSMAVR